MKRKPQWVKGIELGLSLVLLATSSIGSVANDARSGVPAVAGGSDPRPPVCWPGKAKPVCTLFYCQCEVGYPKFTLFK